MAGKDAGRGGGRRVVVCDGVRGVFARGADGRWGLANGGELAVLEGLGGSWEGVSRLRGMGAALEAGVAGAGDLVELNRCFRSLLESDNAFWAKVPADLVPAVTVACAWWRHVAGGQWLCWVLASRLAGNLSDSWWAGAGWHGWVVQAHPWRDPVRWNGADWIGGLGEGFWDKVALHPDRLVRESAVAGDPDASPAMLKELSSSSDSLVLDLVASHPRTPARALKQVCERRLHHRQLLRVAQNMSAPPHVLGWLSKTEPGPRTDWLLPQLFWLLAGNPNTPPAAVGRLSRFGHQAVRGRAACHPNAGVRALQRLAGDPVWWVRCSVSQHPSAPGGLIGRLAGDARREVRAAVAERAGLAEDLLERLAADRSHVVRAGAAANPGLPQRLIQQLGEDPDPRVRRVVAERADIPQSFLGAMAADPHWRVRERLGNNSAVPATVVASLADDPHIWVQQAAAEHPKAPPHALRRFSRSRGFALRWCAAVHPATPPDALERLAGDKDPEIKDNAARHPKTPRAALERLAADPDRYVRAAVAENPAVPDALIEQLAKDDHAVVMAAAAEALAQRRAGNAPGDNNPQDQAAAP